MDNDSKMTPEQQQLLMDNISVFYKSCSQYNIYDEDDRQTILLRLCQAIKTYNSEKGAISTFIYKVVYNEMISIWSAKQNKIDTYALSLNDTVLSDDEYDLTIEEICGDEDDNYALVENREAFQQILNEYKQEYPDTWETDLNVYKAIVFHKDKLEIVRKYHVRYTQISLIFRRVAKFFKEETQISYYE